MKKTGCLLLTVMMCLAVLGQTDSIPQPPYKRFPAVPAFRLLLSDSATWVTKYDLPARKPVLLVVFSPDCEHCKHETEEILKRIDDFKKITIVMATPMQLDKMKAFGNQFGLQRFSNIILGRDTNFMLPVFYNMRNFPFLAFYDKKGALIDAFEGSMTTDQILAKFDK